MNVTNRNRLGTWLSPLAQPASMETTAAPPADAPRRRAAAAPPRDFVHRRYLHTLARMQSSFVSENQRFYCEPASDAFRAYPLFATAATQSSRIVNGADPQTLQRSILNSPITCPFQIRPQAARARLERNKRGRVMAAALVYGWSEELELENEAARLMYIQVRQHTKLENYHDIRRPVYCVNAQSCDRNSIDLRLMAIIFTELPILSSAAREFAHPEDYAGGDVVLDQHGRAWLDDRVVRRAAYDYAQHQIQRPHDQLYRDEDNLDDRVRRAHLLVLRSHLPEFATVKNRES